MKVNLETINKYLKNNEEVLSTLYCTINLGYISRSGILAATNKKLLFCADYMFGKGLKWEFEYSQISNFNDTNGVILDQATVPFIKKIIMNYKDDFMVFTNFSSQSNVSDFSKLIKCKIENERNLLT